MRKINLILDLLASSPSRKHRAFGWTIVLDKPWNAPGVGVVPLSFLRALTPQHISFITTDCAPSLVGQILAHALSRKNADLLKALIQNNAVLHVLSFQQTMQICLTQANHHPQLSSTLLAMIADYNLGREKWKRYAEGLVEGLRQNAFGVFGWAHKMDLPIFSLPVREALVKAYGTIPSDDAFFHGWDIAQAMSGHDIMRLTKTLDLSGGQAHQSLFDPNPDFLKMVRHRP